MERVFVKDNGLNFEKLKKTITRLGTEFSKGILVPVFTLPIIGMLLAVGILLTNPSIPISKIVWINNFGLLTKDSLLSIFINLSPIFAVGIASGMAKKKKGDAGLSGIILFFIFLYSMNSFMRINNILITGDLRGSGQSLVLGVQVLDMGVFLGIIIGLITSYLHNMFVDKEFDGAMRLYGSSNLALLIGIPVTIILSILFTYMWPGIQISIAKMTNIIVSTGIFGVGIYGFLERILIPTGLHHLLWVPVELSSISGTGVVDGQYLEGVRNIAMA
ncbi:MAG: PTS transporter subunit EIIC, partial [Cetobacterium sp.]